MIKDMKFVYGELVKMGWGGIWKAFIKDLFLNRTLNGYLYLIALSSVPIILELTSNNPTVDWLGLIASWTGIVCVILVAEGRTSNYLFGTINALIYLYMSWNATFYGELLTTLYFVVMQPIGLYMWVKNKLMGVEDKKDTELHVKKLGLVGWLKYLGLTAIIWLLMGFAYKGINSARPFRDSVTDGTNYVGQLLMNGVYREQWVFWIATNVFSIYLWWGSNVHIQGMYWVFLVNSIVGWYNWSKNIKQSA